MQIYGIVSRCFSQIRPHPRFDLKIVSKKVRLIRRCLQYTCKVGGQKYFLSLNMIIKKCIVCYSHLHVQLRVVEIEFLFNHRRKLLSLG